MAAGKSSVARALGRRLGWASEDVDDLIETREHASVAQIFAARGEPYFRAAEREVLRGLLPPRHVVVATGGGTFVDPDNRAAINWDGMSVWLDVPFEQILQRIPADGRRPSQRIAGRWKSCTDSRCRFYQLAHVRLDAAQGSVEELAEKLLDRLGY